MASRPRCDECEGFNVEFPDNRNYEIHCLDCDYRSVKLLIKHNPHEGLICGNGYYQWRAN